MHLAPATSLLPDSVAAGTVVALPEPAWHATSPLLLSLLLASRVPAAVPLLSLQEASVIVLCFSMDKPGTLRRVSSYWMPELRRLGVHVPVMLVGCKSDVRPADRSLHEVGGEGCVTADSLGGGCCRRCCCCCCRR